MELAFAQYRKPLSPDLVASFFSVFARFEYALKAAGFAAGVGHRRAEPQWSRFASVHGYDLMRSPDRDVQIAIATLVNDPPMVEMMSEENTVFWATRPLAGKNNGTRAIHAVQRVRNNLFHGGKHTNHSSPERDRDLVRASLVILSACLELDQRVRTEFYDEY